jgi:hypothetical protein
MLLLLLGVWLIVIEKQVCWGISLLLLPLPLLITIQPIPTQRLSSPAVYNGSEIKGLPTSQFAQEPLDIYLNLYLNCAGDQTSKAKQ